MIGPLTEAELDLLDDMNDSAYANITAMADQSLWIRACKATPRLVTELREARAERDALRVLLRLSEAARRDALVALEDEYSASYHDGKSHDPADMDDLAGLTDEQTALLCSVLDGAS